MLDGKNFIGRIVDVNFFSSRVLLVTDLNSKIPVIIEPIKNGRLSSEYVSHIEDRLEAEYYPFYFHDLRTNEVIGLHAFITNLNENFNILA